MTRPGATAVAAVRRHLPARRPLAEFVNDELVGGVILLAATLVALVWANAWPGAYHDLWSFIVGPGRLGLALDLHHWINDALMALFFFVVGLEIKRELVVGELSRPRAAAMPVVAAIGGMVVPAALYAAVVGGGAGRAGWGIPMATDIAFVLGALALLGTRAPAGLRLFLLAVAIVDDLGAIAVIAVFYARGTEPLYLVAAVGLVAGVVGMRRLGVIRPVAYALPAVVLWYAVYRSGVHATVAGVALGLLTPAGEVGGRPVLDELQDRLHPVSAMVVVPLFALANAGVVIRSDTWAAPGSTAVAVGIGVGLVVGKPVGITVAALAAHRLGLGQIPPGVSTGQLVGGAALAGIGFTVALFIADLAFDGGPLLPGAKVAILVASVLSAIVGTLILRRTHRPVPGL